MGALSGPLNEGSEAALAGPGCPVKQWTEGPEPRSGHQNCLRGVEGESGLIGGVRGFFSRGCCCGFPCGGGGHGRRCGGRCWTDTAKGAPMGRGSG